MTEFVADPTALREMVADAISGQRDFAHQTQQLYREADAVVDALLASGVVQPREDVVREAKAEAWDEGWHAHIGHIIDASRRHDNPYRNAADRARAGDPLFGGEGETR